MIYDHYIGIKVDEYQEYNSPEISTKQMTFSELVQETNDNELLGYDLLRIGKQVDGKISDLAQQRLRQHGWINKDGALKANEKKVMEERFYLMKEPDHFGLRHFEEIDPNSLTMMQEHYLSEGAKIVQVVEPKSVLSKSAYKNLKAAQDKKEEAARKRKEAEEARKKKDKVKELERARKLLAEAGELPQK